MVLASAYDQKCSLRTLVLKTDVILVQTLRLIILDFFFYLEILFRMVRACNVMQ